MQQQLILQKFEIAESPSDEGIEFLGFGSPRSNSVKLVAGQKVLADGLWLFDIDDPARQKIGIVAQSDGLLSCDFE